MKASRTSFCYGNVGVTFRPSLVIEGGKAYFEFFWFCISCTHFLNVRKILSLGHSADDLVVHVLHISFADSLQCNDLTFFQWCKPQITTKHVHRRKDTAESLTSKLDELSCLGKSIKSIWCCECTCLALTDFGKTLFLNTALWIRYLMLFEVTCRICRSVSPA